MADNSVFDPQKLQSGNLADCEEQQILELAKKLCRIAAEECGEDGFRGGIRPGNIYVAEDGRVAVGKSGRSGENGWTKLELEYLAPEVFWNGEESAAADVYSIALIMYAGLNDGRLPFAESAEPSSEKRAYALRRRMSGDSFPMPEDISEKLAEILKRALAFEPEQRYGSSYDMLRALWDYCGDEPEEIRPGPPPAPEPGPAPAAEPVPEKKPEQSGEKKKPAKKSEKKKAPPAPEPAKKPAEKEEKKPEPKSKPEAKTAASAPTPEKKPGRTIHEIRAARRSAATLLVISLLLVGVGLARNGLDLGYTPQNGHTQSPDKIETTASPTAEPEQTPAPSKTPADVQYMLYTEDLSWNEAEEQCRSLGGHLVTIKDQDDYDRVCQLLADCSAQYVWIGAYRDGDQIKWADGESSDFCLWAQGEPSLTDSYDGAAENYIMLVKQADGTWLYNDSREDPLEQYASFYSGRIAYICQLD